MTWHTYSDNALVKPALNCAPTNGTQHSAAIDTLAGNGAPFRRAAAVIDAVTGSATTVQVTISESDTSARQNRREPMAPPSALVGTGGWTVVTSSTNPAVAQAASLPASGLGGQTYITNIDLAKRKRFLRADLVGTGTAGTVTVDVILFEGPYLAPTQDNTAVSV